MLASQLQSLDLWNAKELKHCSSSTLPITYTMANFANSKCFGKKKRKKALDVEKMCQSWKIKFTSMGSAITSSAFDVTVNLSIDCWISKEVVHESTLSTHTS